MRISETANTAIDIEKGRILWRQLIWVIVNPEGLPPEEQMLCLSDIRQNIRQLKAYIEENLREKEELKEIPETGKQVLGQQYALAQSLEAWIDELTLLS